MKINLTSAYMMMQEDESDDDVGSLEKGLAAQRTVERHEKPVRYSNKIDNRQEGTLAHYGNT